MMDRAKDSRTADQKAADAKAADHRKKMHDALDKAIADGKFEGPQFGDPDPKKGEDADMSELKKLMGEYMGEEEKEPEHAEDLGAEASHDPDLIPEEGVPSGATDKGRAADKSADFIEPDQDTAKDRAAEIDLLKMLKPAVMKTADEMPKDANGRRGKQALSLINRYNQRMAFLKGGKAESSGGGYGEFAASASTRTKDGAAPTDEIVKLNKFYESRHGKPMEAN
jgi:hypothetical protein